MDLEILKADLRRDEAVRDMAYRDPKGIMTIGVGHNLETRPISARAIDVILEDDIAFVRDLLDRELPWWKDLDDVRQVAFANLAFNLGVGPTPEDPTGKLLTFHGTLEALSRHDYAAVVSHLQATPWAQQVGPRATRIIGQLRTGLR